MDARRTSGDSAVDYAATRDADRIPITAICPACGYPTLNPGLCAFCRPTLAP